MGKEILVFAETEKTVIFSVVRKNRLKELTDTLEERFRTVRGGTVLSSGDTP